MIQRILILIFTILTLFLLCSRKQQTERQPSPLTDSSKVVSLFKTNSSVNIHKVNALFDTLPEQFASNVLSNCGVNKLAFDDSMVYYLSRDSISPHWSIITDINGDSISDFCGFLLCNDSLLKLTAIYSKEGGFKDTILRCDTIRQELKLYKYLEVLGPGHIQGFPFDNVPDSETVADLNWPGIHLVFYEASSVLYYWKIGTIHELWTGD
jgi:hypothetical protein